MPAEIESTMAKVSFDFRGFLARLEPSAEYQTRSLSGGLVNLTDRATRVSPRGGSRFPGHDSLILKHAPPFVAALGPPAPFSQRRQVVPPDSGPSGVWQQESDGAFY